MGLKKNTLGKIKVWLKSKYRYVRHKQRFLGFVVALLIIVGWVLMMSDAKQVQTAQLLDTIAKVESSNNYNAYYGKTRNNSVKFTTMSVREVTAWQRDFVAQGSPSSAVGRYQFLLSTLQSLVKELNVDEDAKFDEQLQDRFAAALLERRGLSDYVENKISREQFAHNLSKEWAALPKVLGENPEQSYYAEDGINQARLSIKDFSKSIDTVKTP